MRNAFIYILFILSLGCTPIDKLEPNQTDAFLKFYSETNEMNSKDLAVLSDGYLILSTYSETSTLLLKTDLQGNKLWAKSFDNFNGNSLLALDDGYILIGDRINDQKDSTYMHLIKTGLQGDNLITTELGNGFQHGTAVNLNSNNEIIALGYSTSGDSILLLAYPQDLSPSTWSRKYLHSVSSKSIYETDDGHIKWLSYSNINGSINNLNFTEVLPDNEGIILNPPLFFGSEFSNVDGDILKDPIDGHFTVVQTINNGRETKIGVSAEGFEDVILNEGDFSSGNYTVSSLTNLSNGLLLAATTNKHEESARNDKDLLLIETNYNGSVKSNGINISYGGIGDEVPVRIRKTNDGGFAVLGTLTNSKGAQQTFLLKTNSKGELN